MRRIVLPLALLLLVVSTGMTDGPGVIKAGGSAVAYIMPDQGRVYCSIRVEGKETAPAREELARKASAAIAAVKALKIAGLQVSTHSYSVTPLVKPAKGAPPRGGKGGPGAPPGGDWYYEDEDTPQEIIGYRVKSSITVTVSTDAERLAPAMSQVIDALSKGGTNYVTGPTFTVGDPSAIRKEVLTRATRQAVENAQAIAAGLGVSIKSYSYAGMFPETEAQDQRIGELAAGGGEDENAPAATPTPIEIRPIPITYVIWVSATY